MPVNTIYTIRATTRDDVLNEVTQPIIKELKETTSYDTLFQQHKINSGLIQDSDIPEGAVMTDSGRLRLCQDGTPGRRSVLSKALSTTSEIINTYMENKHVLPVSIDLFTHLEESMNAFGFKGEERNLFTKLHDPENLHRVKGISADFDALGDLLTQHKLSLHSSELILQNITHQASKVVDKLHSFRKGCLHIVVGVISESKNYRKPLSEETEVLWEEIKEKLAVLASVAYVCENYISQLPRLIDAYVLELQPQLATAEESISNLFSDPLEEESEDLLSISTLF